MSESEYGALASNLPDHGSEKYYLTTAISYTNGSPHIGHAYEFVTSDALVRFHRALGYDTYFVTGTDEHGQKVAASAEKAGKDPLSHCDGYVAAFKELDERLLIRYSDFVRTTEPGHELTSKTLWKMCADAGDIYLDSYEGWYNEREEVFVSQADAEAADFKDVGSGLPLKRVKEESYFFRMSAYCERLLKYIQENPSFIEPEQYRNQIVSRLVKEGLKDLSISRTSFSWGIPVPEGFDARHVMYVWFDALSNYLTGVDALNVAPRPHAYAAGTGASATGTTTTTSTSLLPPPPSPPPSPNSSGQLPPGSAAANQHSPLQDYWPASKHIIGKDIVWFHCVIWPCMLMSARLPLPAGVFAHGFVNAADGRKMSKSYNNTIDPNDILAKYPVDTIRYYLCAAATYGMDLNFSEDSLVTMHNSELADILGNLVHRVLNLAQKYCSGAVPETSHDATFGVPFDLAALKSGIRQDMESCALHLALFKAMEAVRATNRFLSEAEPWKMKGAELELRRMSIVRTAMEAIYAFAHFLAPVMPTATHTIFARLNTPPVSSFNLKDDFYNLVPGTPVALGDILFQKIEMQEDKAASATAIAATVATTGKPSATGKGKSKGGGGATTAVVEELHEIDFTKVDLRVGRITRVWQHETADRLYCEEIDLGAAAAAAAAAAAGGGGGSADREIRQVVSGLRGHYSLEELQDRLVVVVCNLKESKFQGVMSYGMVLAAKGGGGGGGGGGDNNNKVELLTVPEGTAVGERVMLDGFAGAWPDPLTPARMKKVKGWEAVVPDLATNETGIACWRALALITSKGPCTVSSLVNMPIS